MAGAFVCLAVGQRVQQASQTDSNLEDRHGDCGDQEGEHGARIGDVLVPQFYVGVWDFQLDTQRMRLLALILPPLFELSGCLPAGEQALEGHLDPEGSEGAIQQQADPLGAGRCELTD